MAEPEKRRRLASLSCLARERPGWVAALKWLVVLTVLAALPIDPEGPLDARTHERADDFHLEFPIAGAAVEPFAAPGHAIAGAPDVRVAAISTLVWVLMVAAGVTILVELRRAPGRAWWAAALRTFAGGGAAAGVFLVYCAFAVLVRFPSWRLEHDDPDVVVADLQTHTFGSHDGVVSARDNLEWHRARGFDVVAVTEHDDATGSIEARKLADFFADDLPAVIPGVEMRSGEGAYLLALGLDPEIGPKVLRAREDLVSESVHTLHRGAVVALAWKLDADDARRLAGAGVDGFEIANAGHPDLPDRTRKAVLDVARGRGLVLVASSDWHGWGGFWRTWTAVRVEGAAKLPPSGKAASVLAALRERRTGDVIPLVAGHVGPPGVARAILSPAVEALRYAAELSWPRVASWWVWTALAALATAGLRRAGLRPGRTLLGLLLLVLGAGLVWKGGALIWAKATGLTATSFPRDVGLWAVGVGVAALAAAIALAVGEVRRLLPAREDEEGEDDASTEGPAS
jgi:hypothetical protein